MNDFNEAMGLASMNPVPGINKTPESKRGAIFINSVDKDLTSGWGSYSVTRDFDNKKRITLNNEGKLIVKNNDDLMNEKSNIYIIKSDNCDEVFDSLLEELDLHIQERPIHTMSYIYEAFTGHTLYTMDQIDYDPLLEKVYLDKMTKYLNGSISDIGTTEKKDSRYPIERAYNGDYDQEDANVNFPILASYKLDEIERDLDQLSENEFNLKLRNKLQGLIDTEESDL